MCTWSKDNSRKYVRTCALRLKRYKDEMICTCAIESWLCLRIVSVIEITTQKNRLGRVIWHQTVLNQ